MVMAVIGLAAALFALVNLDAHPVVATAGAVTAIASLLFGSYICSTHTQTGE